MPQKTAMKSGTKVSNTKAIAPKASKRSRMASTSSSGSGTGSEDGQDDRAAMLAALQAHGRAMFGLDGPEEAESSDQGRRRLSGSSASNDEGVSDDNEDDDAEGFSSDDGWGEGDEMVTDSEEETLLPPPGLFASLMSDFALTPAVKAAAPVSRVQEVVFTENRGGAEAISKSDRRAFLVSLHT